MKRKTIQEVLEELKNQDKKVSPGDITGDEFEEWLKEKKEITKDSQYIINLLVRRVRYA